MTTPNEKDAKEDEFKMGERRYKAFEVPPMEPFQLCLQPRDYWGAKKARYRVPLQIPIMYMCITYRQPLRESEDEREVLREMQDHDMDRGMPDIESNFLIGKGGVVYEGRGWFSSPSLADQHTPQMKQHIGKYFQVTYFADYETDPQTNPLLKASAVLLQEGLLRNIVSHNMQFIEVKIVKGDKTSFQSLYN